VITVTRAPPYLTVQDLGRKYLRSSGVPRGGAMDLFAVQALNAIVGNPFGAATLEWALSGGALRFERDCAFAFGGARVNALLAGTPVPPFTTCYAEKGAELVIEQLIGGRFLYLAVSGGIDVPEVMRSRSTYLPGHFGGLGGRMIARDDSLPLGARPAVVPAEGFNCPGELLPRYESEVVHVIRGTHADLFDESDWDVFANSEFTLSPTSDRTGYRLKGATLRNSAGNLPSDPGCYGAIQIPTDGAPIVLMADAPTVGGYPKIAAVSDADLPILAQRSPAETVRFELITIEQSQRALKRRASDLHTIRSSGAASA
jgi:antagonist of KipI